MRKLLTLTLIAAGTASGPASLAEDGITADEVLLGQSCALSGPAQALGIGMRDGLQACFGKVNAGGGIKGRTIRLVTKDDGYEPMRAIRNTRTLIAEDKVFLLIGEVGTPTSQAAVPIAEEMKVPFVGPFTGAEFLRNPVRKYVINLRGSYYEEMEKLAEYVVDKKGLTRIACFYQNDGYGQAGLNGIKRALEARNMKLVATGIYERNTIAVKGAVLSVHRGRPEAVMMVGAYKPCAEFIKLAKTIGLKDTIYCNISFVGTEALLKELGDVGEGCVISQVVRFPWDETVPVIAEYREAMKQYRPGSQIGFVSLEGYLVGRLFCAALEKTPGEPTRETFIETIERIGTFDFDGCTLQFGPNDHQGTDEVFLTAVRDGVVRPLKD